MNKYTHLSDQERMKAMLPVLTELLKIVTVKMKSFHLVLLMKHSYLNWEVN